ncbi:MAG: MBL fold metallo-hydrolase [Clostridia bacterium]|nr:MBL fold metallo-hydrolase [Clostridia bacterium]
MASKKRRKAARRMAKKHPVLTTVVIVLVLLLIGCCVLHTQGVIHIPFLDSLLTQDEENTGANGTKDSSQTVEGQGGAFTEEVISEISGSSVSIHFLELGNEYTGDCTLVKVGNTEVLIDAGSRKGSAAAIVPYVQNFCTDGVLEYVIATHAHQDHIAGFVGTTKAAGIFESFVCETIIDYPLYNTNSQIRKDYETLRDAEVEAGAKHYTALECWNNANGASRSYTLGTGVTMQILYQEFYETQTSDENDYSVCMLLTEGENNYLFTGDLEKDGEASLVKENDLPKCVLYKGGHHGSPTSSTTELLHAIDPDIVCVCCCCGSDEYTDNVANMFPSQAFVDRIAPYTDRVYVTTVVSEADEGYTSMNGNIVVYSKNGEISIRCSNNATLFKDTDWFKANRTLPAAWGG